MISILFATAWNGIGSGTITRMFYTGIGALTITGK
jgi:hypothetical protein